MSETSRAGAPPPQLPQSEAPDMASLRTIVMLCYVLFLIACVSVVTAIAGVIIAYVKRHDAVGTIWESHFNNLILVFWVVVGGTILMILTWPIAIGAFLGRLPLFWPPTLGLPFAFAFLSLIFPILAIWYLYRVIRGLIRAGEERVY